MSKIRSRVFLPFLHLFISNSCYACERPLLEQEKYVCFSCLGQIPETDFLELPKQNELYYRLGGKVPIEDAFSLFYFDKKGKLQSLIEQLKYKSSPQVGRFLGAYCGNKIKDSEFIKDVDALIPVPLHNRKRIIRGYNQAEEIAKGLGEILEIPVLRKHLFRTRFTLSQTRKKGSDRWENVANAFVSKGNLPKSILLIDDVVTTGATLEACIRSLHQAPQAPKEVKVLSIALARKN